VSKVFFKIKLMKPGEMCQKCIFAAVLKSAAELLTVLRANAVIGINGTGMAPEHAAREVFLKHCSELQNVNGMVDSTPCGGTCW
uniref:Uncharacterized protein n=1 Tax=Mus spicilegus TaxID=10103 RepID=A0A8C6GVB3_MUSSI